MSLTNEQRAAVKANLFPGARGILDDQPEFPWHRDPAAQVTAAWPHSSQALAVDVLWGINRLLSKDRILDTLCRTLALPYVGPWTLSLEVAVDKDLLGETRSSQIDAIAKSPSGILVIECKFTESDGGSCSQTQPLGGKGPHAGQRQCNGKYVLQDNPVTGKRAKCSLASKGIRYWDTVPSVFNLNADEEYSPCPFSGGWYQWMRNLVVADLMGRQRCVPAAFLVLYADGPFPMASKVSGSSDWHRLLASTDGRSVPIRTVSYQSLLDLACESALPEDAQTAADLRSWVGDKISLVASRSPQPLQGRRLEAASDTSTTATILGND